jgi:DeoR/GlpR family transcriptional regulator of sugar metabolism
MPARTKSHGAVERRRVILEATAADQKISVVELSQQLNVSEVTIRRDLESLDRAGLLRRVHGGAQAALRPGQLSVIEARLLRNVESKRAIAQAAVALIKPGHVIFLDSGTTVLEVARNLPDDLLETGGLTVITRSLLIATELRHRRQIRLIVVGGVYVHDFDDFVGPQVEQALQSIHVNTLFIGTDGVSPERGLTTDNVLEAGLYRQMAGVAERVVVVADTSKIGVDKLQTILPFEAIHAFVADAAAPADFVQTLREKGINVILAPQT